jgi:hypothetical protein
MSNGVEVAAAGGHNILMFGPIARVRLRGHGPIQTSTVNRILVPNSTIVLISEGFPAVLVSVSKNSLFSEFVDCFDQVNSKNEQS